MVIVMVRNQWKKHQVSTRVAVDSTEIPVNENESVKIWPQREQTPFIS